MTPEQRPGATGIAPDRRRPLLESGEDLIEQRGDLLQQPAQPAGTASCVVEQMGNRAEKVAEEDCPSLAGP
jgi:hypothetical protein